LNEIEYNLALEDVKDFEGAHVYDLRYNHKIRRERMSKSENTSVTVIEEHYLQSGCLHATELSTAT
jgi:hypothetical protein